MPAPDSHEQHGVAFAARMASPPKGPQRVYPPTPKEMTRHIGDMTSPAQLQPLLQKHPGRVGHIQLTAAVAQAAWLLREGVWGPGTGTCLFFDAHPRPICLQASTPPFSHRRFVFSSEACTCGDLSEDRPAKPNPAAEGGCAMGQTVAAHDAQGKRACGK